MKKVFVQSIGCGSRGLDAQRFRNYFMKNNHKIINTPKKADIIIFVTCGYMNSVSNFCFNMIKKFQKYDVELIVAGCLPAIQSKKLSQIFKGKIIVTEDLNNNPEKIDKLFLENKIKFDDIEDPNTVGIWDVNQENPLEKLKEIFISPYLKSNTIGIMALLIGRFFPKFMEQIFGEKSGLIYYFNLLNQPVYLIRASWGCTGNCSYCGIKKAIGAHVSKPLEQCINEFKKGLKAGYKNFDISSQDIGQYGLDIGSSFPELLDKITDIEGDYKIVVSGLNPVWLVKYIDSLEKIIKKGNIRLISCPFQSGSSRVLKLMKRYSNIEKMKESYLRLKKSSKDLRIFPQVILGFPTETDEDVEKTLEFIKEINFNSGEIFLCSLIPGTKAAEMTGFSQKTLLKRSKSVKKSLKKQGYRVIYRSKPDAFAFYKKS